MNRILNSAVRSLRGSARWNTSRSKPGPLLAKPKPSEDIVEFARIELGGEPDPWQVEVLLATLEHSRIAVVASRQSGKSTIVAIALAYLFVHNPNFRIVVLSKTLAQASYFMRKVKRAVLRYLERREMEVVNTLSIMHRNGSMCVCVPCRDPDAARGYDPNVLLADEAAFVPAPTWAAVTPMIAATQGALFMISSANGPRGDFYESVEGNLARFFWPRKVKATECPRITPEFLEELRQNGTYVGPDFKIDHLGYEDADNMDGAFYPHCDKLRIYDIPDSSPNDITDMEIIADVSYGIPVLGAVKMDITGKYRGQRIKVGKRHRLVALVHGGVAQAEFDHRAQALEEARVGRAAGGRCFGALAGFGLHRGGDQR